jgi:DNA-binding MarR family transcriptional regulator
MHLAVTGIPLRKRRRTSRPLSVAQRKLLEAILEEPGSTAEELASENIYCDLPCLVRALSGLIARGFVTFTPGPCTSYTLTVDAKRILTDAVK